MFARLTSLILLAFSVACGDSSASVDGSVRLDGALDGGFLPDATLGAVPLSDFRPETDGFGFENYTNAGMPQNMTGAEMRGIFGDRVCERLVDGRCILKPPAQAWMAQMNALMDNGHCEGMAVMSLMLFQGLQRPGDFGATQTSQLRMEGNDALTRSIARWFAMQVPLAMQRLAGTPTQQLERLRASLNPGATELYTIAFFRVDAQGRFTGGHAVTPFGIQEADGGAVDILVYDNNFPGVTRAIRVDVNSDTWSYEASATPGNPTTLYQGDARTPTLLLVPLSARLAQQPCPFCGDVSGGMNGSRLVAVSGEGEVLISDPSGARLGVAEGRFVNEISGASALPLLSDDLFAETQDPFYVLPGGADLQVVLTGAEIDRPSQSAVVISGPGYALGVSDILLDPGQQDAFAFGGSVPSVYYETQASETAVVELALETAAADWAFAVRSRGDAAGQAIEVQADLRNGDLVMAFAGADGESEFDLAIERAEESGSLLFASDGIVVPNGAVLYLAYADFDADGEALTLYVDYDGDGEPDDEAMLPDQR